MKLDTIQKKMRTDPNKLGACGKPKIRQKLDKSQIKISIISVLKNQIKIRQNKNGPVY